MPEIVLIFSTDLLGGIFDLPEIIHSIAMDMPDICLTFAWNFPDMCLTFV